MHYSSTLMSLGLIASTAFAAPFQMQKRGPGGEVAVYWGQNTATASENNDLSTYCKGAGVDIVILAFLNEWGASGTIPAGTIGRDCTISTSGDATGCDQLASQIKSCQADGVKVMLSLGGGVGAYSLDSQTQAEKIGQYLWDAYGDTPAKSGVTRPFGDSFVNGFDLDIESNSGNEYYKDMLSTLRTNFKTDSSKEYYISGAPQCIVPDANMGEIITAAEFDYLWVQFYNNPSCSNPNTPNFDAWVTYLANTASPKAKVFLGVPASTKASGSSDYYMTPKELSKNVASFDTSSNWGGIMMWDAAFSDGNVVDGCTYAEQAASILKNGSPCGSSPASSATKTTTTAKAATTTTAKAATTTSPVASATGSAVPQWGQCGGNGYTGSTECASGYKCVTLSQWWSQCE